jgi:hypothetical protein
MALRDRNTVKMVADFWGCSPDLVYDMIAAGTLPCIRLHGTIRVTREQVEACEAACSTKLVGLDHKRAANIVNAQTRDPFQLGQLAAGRDLRKKPR